MKGMVAKTKVNKEANKVPDTTPFANAKTLLEDSLKKNEPLSIESASKKLEELRVASSNPSASASKSNAS